MSRSKWTLEEDALMRLHYPNKSMPELVRLIGRSACSIYNRSHTLNLNKSAEYLASDAACRLRRGDNVGKEHRFEKGLIPWNKGLKGINRGGKETQFKKGSMPKNTMPIGSLRITREGILERKISNESGSSKKRWRSVHELVWMEVNGEIPKGYICVFKAGMKTNDPDQITADKVECISRAENMKRNSYHRYGKEIASLIQLRGAINRQINKRSKQNEQSANT